MSKSTYKAGQIYANPELAEYDPQASLRRMKTPMFDVLSEMERNMLVRQIKRGLEEHAAMLRRRRQLILGVVWAILTAVFIAAVFVAACWIL